MQHRTSVAPCQLAFLLDKPRTVNHVAEETSKGRCHPTPALLACTGIASALRELRAFKGDCSRSFRWKGRCPAY